MDKKKPSEYNESIKEIEIRILCYETKQEELITISEGMKKNLEKISDQEILLFRKEKKVAKLAGEFKKNRRIKKKTGIEMS